MSLTTCGNLVEICDSCRYLCLNLPSPFNPSPTKIVTYKMFCYQSGKVAMTSNPRLASSGSIHTRTQGAKTTTVIIYLFTILLWTPPWSTPTWRYVARRFSANKSGWWTNGGQLFQTWHTGEQIGYTYKLYSTILDLVSRNRSNSNCL